MDWHGAGAAGVKVNHYGRLVTCKVYGGGEVVRRVVDVKPTVVVICNEAEWIKAKAEKRPPTGIGFPHEDVIWNDPAPEGPA